MREPIAAGKYYERDAVKLSTEIAAHYDSGPGSLPLRKIEHNVKAIIAPNSPYKNCGDCMAWAYKELSESPTPDVYIIIGTGKQEGVSLTTFKTPIEAIRVDQELSKAIASSIGVNELAHANELVIEVQLPFLQHAKQHDLERIKIVPILVSEDTDVKTLALDIKEALVDLKREPIYIVSSAMTHIGPLFHYVPFSVDVEEQLEALDKELITEIIEQDPEGLVDLEIQKLLPENKAIELLLHLLPKCNVRHEQYSTSADATDDTTNIVSYAAIIFE